MLERLERQVPPPGDPPQTSCSSLPATVPHNIS